MENSHNINFSLSSVLAHIRELHKSKKTIAVEEPFNISKNSTNAMECSMENDLAMQEVEKVKRALHIDAMVDAILAQYSTRQATLNLAPKINFSTDILLKKPD